MDAAIEPDALLLLSPVEYFSRFIESGIRPDGRTPTQGRAPNIVRGNVPTACGSAAARFGGTVVLAGVCAEAQVATEQGEPVKGALLARFEYATVCGARQRFVQSAEAVEQLLQKALDASGAVPAAALEIDGNRAAWRLTLQVYCLGFDGNVFDAALAAACAALQDAKLPAMSFDTNLGKWVPDESSVPTRLGLGDCPMAVSFARVQGAMLLDPSAAEELVAESSFTVVVDRLMQACLVVKPGGVPVDGDWLQKEAAVIEQRSVVLSSQLHLLDSSS